MKADLNLRNQIILKSLIKILNLVVIKRYQVIRERFYNFQIIIVLINISQE